MPSEVHLLTILPHISPDYSTFSITALAPNEFGALVSAAEDGLARLWSREGQLQSALNHPSPIFAVEWNPSGTLFLTLSRCLASVWDSWGECVRSYVGTELSNWGWRGEWELVIAGQEGVATWDLNQGEVKVILQEPVDNLAVSGSLIAAVQKGCVKVISEESLWSFSSECSCLSWHLHTLVVGTPSGNLSLWNVETREEVKEFEAHKGTVTKLKERGDGELFVSVGEDSVINVWSWSKFAKVRSLSTKYPLADM